MKRSESVTAWRTLLLRNEIIGEIRERAAYHGLRGNEIKQALTLLDSQDWNDEQNHDGQLELAFPPYEPSNLS